MIYLKNQNGIALILTLLIVTILTAIVIEFSYGVYIATTSLDNWQTGQRLSTITKSGVKVAVQTILDLPIKEMYKAPARIQIPANDIISDFQGQLFITIEDENSKFNINSLINDNQTLNLHSYNLFRRLLKKLQLKEEIADIISDWIDKDREPRLKNSEDRAKNSYLESLEELLLIDGIDMLTFNKLKPFLTIYGVDKINSHLININTASEIIIMSLDDKITKETAEKIIHSRPFENISSVEKVAPGIGLGPTKIITNPSIFRIDSSAEENKIKKTIECVVDIKGKIPTIKFWQET
ncbi:MAG: type II secretion system minor pseudopilin GspK [Thermodesulfovibrionales bacterium]|nr:type II secretion system minor pseudopilin GspK [Thermodesulfovibrionales bacterium]